jgi:DNA-binding transcriptional MerR regulator
MKRTSCQLVRMEHDGVRIGEAAALYGLNPSTLRWWERRGVLPSPPLHGRQRLYREDDLRRLGLAFLCCVVGGMSLDKAATVTSVGTVRQKWRRAVEDQVTEFDQRIERLTATRDYLNDLLRCRHDDPSQCPDLDGELIHRSPRGSIDEPDLIRAARQLGRMPASGARRDTEVGDEGVAPSRRRDETQPTHCAACGRAFLRPRSGRPRLYCSQACRQTAYRARQRGTVGSRSAGDAPHAATPREPTPAPD